MVSKISFTAIITFKLTRIAGLRGLTGYLVNVFLT